MAAWDRAVPGPMIMYLRVSSQTLTTSTAPETRHRTLIMGKDRFRLFTLECPSRMLEQHVLMIGELSR